MSPETFMSLNGELRALSSTFLKRTAIGTRYLPSVIDDVAADAWVELREQTEITERLADRDARSQAESDFIYQAASRAVNRYVRTLKTRGRGDGEIIPFRPTGDERDDESATFNELALDRLAEAEVEDVYFADDEDGLLTIDFGRDDLNVVAQGLADGLDYTTIASRLGYDGTSPRQFVYSRVRLLRTAMTDVQV